MRVLTSAAGIRSSQAFARGRVFLTLSASERVRLFVTLAIVAVVRLLLSLLPSRVCLRLVRRLDRLEVPAPREDRPSAERLAWTVTTASRVVPRATCLTQAVSAQLLLRHYGYASALCVGVAKSTGADFLAHAWVEHDGRVLVGGAHSATFVQMLP